MRRRIVIALLALGVVGGYGSGIAHLVHHHHACGGWDHGRDHGPPERGPGPEGPRG